MRIYSQISKSFLFILQGAPRYANRHIGKFLELPPLNEDDLNSPIQLIRDGRRLTAQRLLRNQELTLTKPILVHDKPGSIGMKMMELPRGKQVTVRDVANLLGHHYPVHVIDVEHQEELEGWTLADLVEYFEDEERLFLQHQEEFRATQERNNSSSTRRRRKAAEKSMNLVTQHRPRVLNQISLEFSKTVLSEKIQSPEFVREIDWIDHAWPRIRKSDGTLAKPVDEVYPNVQYYCLTSAAGCYTDFHLDFGGTAVWYHVLSGEKTFCLIPPTKENLAIYEDWLCRPDQATVFLPDLIPNPKENILRISLKASQTLMIPTAWIHAVYTPTDSLVIGGNFLHGLDISLQLEVHCIETRTRVQEKFRFPFYLPLNFYAGGYYLDKLRRGNISQREAEGLEELIDALDEWWKVHGKSQSQLQTGPTVVSAATESARKNGCSSVEEFLSELRKEHERVRKEGIAANPLAPKSNSSAVTSLSPVAPSSAGKPKLRLSLKGKMLDIAPPAPMLEYSSAVETAKSGSASPGGSNKFRIVVSSSKWNAAAPVRAKRPREDTEWIDDGAAVEDEWVPAGASKSKRKSGTGPSKVKPGSSSNNVGSPRPQPKPSTTRQRLMKRFR